MKINQAGIDLIKSFEGFEAAPYQCQAGVWTIGYGATRDIYRNPVAEDTPAVEMEEAEHLLRRDLANAEQAVSRLITCNLNENEFSALVSLVFNIGQGNFGRSAVVRCLNKKRFHQAKAEWREWRKAGGKVLAGLVKRREAEIELFEKPTHEEKLS